MTIFDFKPRSDAAIVRNLLSEIEAAQDSGASRQDVWRNLRGHHGLKLSFDAFCVALKRARAKRSKKAGAGIGPLAPASTAGKAEAGRHPEENTAPATGQPNYQHAFSPRGAQQTPESLPRKNRIRTSREFADVHKLDFNEFDDRFK